MLKIGADFYFGGMKVDNPVKIQSENSKRVFFYSSQDGGGRLCEALAFQAVDEMKKALRTRTYNPAMLKLSTVQWKRRYGFKVSIGFMRQDADNMYNNITAFRTTDRTGWLTGMKESAKPHIRSATLKRSGRQMTPNARKLSDVAKWFEFGTFRQVQRPFMRYGLDKMMRENFSKVVYDNFTKQFKKAWKIPGKVNLGWWKRTFRN